jgi:cystathionine gamma-synthase
MRPETLAIHAGQQIDPATGAIVSPINLSTTFERDADGNYPREYVYARDRNPNRDALEAALTTLEGGAGTIMLASGSSAMMTLFQAMNPGDHLLAPDNIYYGVRQLLIEVFAAWGLETSFVDMTDVNAVWNAVRDETRLILIETPSNPLMKITDIEEVARIAHAAGAALACDNTIPTPILQRPLEHGADFVIHATTKYLGGHSDVMGGAIVAKEDSLFFDRLKLIRKVGGAIASPFSCWLTLRGIQTLPHRMRVHSHNALYVAQFLNDHPRVELVLHAGLTGDPGYNVAQKQMSGFGGLMSFLVRGGAEDAMRVTAKVKLFTRATSFGGTHSLIEHRASIEAPGSGTPPNLLRLAVGLEHPDDLIEDLAQALDA